MSNNFNFEEIIKKLEENIKRGEIKFEDFQKAVTAYKELGFRLEKIIEYSAQNTKGEEKNKLWGLYKDISFQNVSELCEKLRSYGKGLRDSGVYERFYDKEKEVPKGMTFRILELTRLGKRDEVFHVILREFITSKEEISQDLAKAFNPKYSEESFKTLIYSFLSGLLG